MTLLTSAQRRKLASTNRQIQKIKEALGLYVEVGSNSKFHKGEVGEIVGWSFREDGEVVYVIRFPYGECICISEEEFQESGYGFIG